MEGIFLYDIYDIIYDCFRFLNFCVTLLLKILLLNVRFYLYTTVYHIVPMVCICIYAITYK